MNEQQELERLLKARQEEMERQWRIYNGLESEVTEQDQEQFARFVRQFEHSCCG